MIKTAITGAGSPDGGELIRILAMHPEVELISISAAGLEGQPITSVHHGLIGETTMSFSSTPDLRKADILFICDRDFPDADLSRLRESRPELKIILLDPSPDTDYKDLGFVYGLPEINRKALVRGATAARVPASFASMALVALFPFAKHLLLGHDLQINVTAPEAIINLLDLPALEKEIEENLREVQKSFTGKISIKAVPSKSRRSALMKIDIETTLTLQQMLDLYDIYDDHRFAFVTTSPVGVSEVAGTDKCVVSLSRSPEGIASLGIAADCRLRGGAGEAVHIMNLLFGLHERTGLALKAIDYENIQA